MPLKVAPDPSDPTKWIWVDAATGQPASQPGGPGTPFIAQSDPDPNAPRPPDVGGPPQGPRQPPKPPGSVGYGEIATTLGSGWKVVPGTLAKEPDKLVQNPDPKAGIEPNVSSYIPQATGRWQVVAQTPQGINRVVYLTPAGTAPPENADPTSPGYNWHIVSAPEVSAADQKGPPSKLQDLKPYGPQGPIAPGDTTKPLFLYDDKTGEKYDVPAGIQPAIHEFGNDLLLIQPDGKFSTITSRPDKPTTTNVPGIGVVTIDPSQPAGKKVNVELAEDKSARASQYQPRVINGQTYLAVDKPGGGIVWQEAKDENGAALPTDVTWSAVNNDPRSSVIQLVGTNGETKEIKKADFHPPPSPGAGQAVTPDTTAPYLVTIGDNGQPVFTQNKNQLSITEATRQFIDGLGVHLASGSISEAQAQELIKNITAQMAAQAQSTNAQANLLQGGTSAAGQALQGIGQGATAGASLLAERSRAAEGIVSGIAGQVMNAPRAAGSMPIPYGQLPSNWGANLVQGAQAYATELGGGPDVYQSAANLIKRADPNNSMGQDAANAYAFFGQAFQKYRDLTGQLHPLEALVNKPPPPSGYTSSTTATPATPVTPPTPTMALPQSPVVSQNYGPATAYTGGVMPWNAQPGPSFVSPITQAPPVPPTQPTLVLA